VVPPSEQDEHSSRPHRIPRDDPDPTRLGPLELRLRADLVSPSIARDDLDAWLLFHDWPPGQTGELVLAVSEAVTNSVEHGYEVTPDVHDHEGIVHVTARVLAGPAGHRYVELVVADHGRWKEPADGIVPGHGVHLIRAVVDDVTIRGTPRGTTVTLRSRPAPIRPRRA
jgi:serine/threonine-protein kinase RsbW